MLQSVHDVKYNYQYIVKRILFRYFPWHYNKLPYHLMLKIGVCKTDLQGSFSASPSAR